jgi:hypothetical protein
MLRSASLSVLLGLALVGCDGGDDTIDTAPVDSDTDPVVQADADEDTILDVHEGDADPDEDGKANFEDKDADGDVIRDRIEAGDENVFTLPIDSDGDGKPDYIDLDSDNNCVTDTIEAGQDNGGAVDTDGDGLRDFADLDNDGDEIDDTFEIGDVDGCRPSDTDGDGTPDFMDLDSDGDGIFDKWESGTTAFDREPVDSDKDGMYDFQDLDSDNDGTPDKDERGAPSGDEPLDTDGDGKYDYQDTDADGDGLLDFDEKNIYKTDPYDFDTDGDGFSDGAEILAETDPLDGKSVIDGIYVVVQERTTVEENFNFRLRIQRGDIAFTTDTTCSMGGTLSAVQASYTTTITDLTATFDDVAGGAAYFDDYAYGSMGGRGIDLPFGFVIGITSDAAAVSSAVAGMRIHGGADGPESSTEAVYQSASGAGYDQNCDGRYDALEDVLPFVSDSSDPFGGTAGENYDPSLPDAGTRGGFGFRDYSLPVIIYATDNYMRRPSATGSHSATPGGCPIDADFADVAVALEDLGGYTIGLDVTGGTGSWGPKPEMLELAKVTGSYADLDADGAADDELVFSLASSSPTFKTDFSKFVVKAVDQLVSSIKFSEVELFIEGDEYGFVTNIEPSKYSGLEPGDGELELPFTLTFRGVVAGLNEDQTFLLTLNVLGDGTTLLDTKDILVVVPGRNN